MDEQRAIAKRLRQEQSRMKHSDMELAGALHLSNPLKVSDYKDGRVGLTATDLYWLADYGYDVNHILTGCGSALVGETLEMSQEEIALVENYRASTPEHQSILDTVSAALAQSGAWRKSNA